MGGGKCPPLPPVSSAYASNSRHPGHFQGSIGRKAGSKGLKSLGVTLDDHLRFDNCSHVRAFAKACTFHTCALRHVWHMLSTELAVTIGCSIVASRLDYCNSLLSGAPFMPLDRLQRSQDMLARVVTQSSSRTSARLCCSRYTGSCQSASA